jgi:DNA-directed RNA polymerase specialized sigma24 family protein
MADLDVFLPAIASGDKAAFARFIAGGELRLRESLRSFAALVDTEAVLQETLLRIWQVAPRVKPDGRADCLLRLGIRTARNLAIDETRRNRRALLDPEALGKALDRADVEAAAHESSADPLIRRAIEECRAGLPAKPGQALSARLEASGGEPDASLAARLGMRLNTFLQNVTRAKKLLLGCLEQRGVAELLPVWVKEPRT